jgi:hypothetical protein
MPPALYYRQSTATDIGAMAKRAGAKHLMLTHLMPPIGAERQGPWKIPGGALTDADYRKVVQHSAFAGKIVVGTDLTSIRLPRSKSGQIFPIGPELPRRLPSIHRDDVWSWSKAERFAVVSLTGFDRRC